MNAYLAIPLLAAVSLTASGSVILMMGIDQRPNRRAAVLVLATALWAFCEVLWNSASDPASALWLHRLSAPGWIFVAPLMMHLVVEVTVYPSDRLRSLLPPAYAACGLLLVLTWFTPWVLESMQPTRWGFALVPGPLFALWASLSGLGLGFALVNWVASYRGSRTLVDRQQGPVIAWATGPAFAAGLLSDALLPILGIQLPRFGSLVTAFGVGVLVWGLYRFGYSQASRLAFSNRILRTLPDGIALTSLNGRIRVANDKLGEMIGCGAAAAVGRPIAPHLDYPFLDGPRELREVECEFIPLEGPPLPVAISCAPLVDESDGVMGVVLIVRDLGEVAALRQRLITSGRLAAVGELAAGIAHEINNPLAFVRSNLGLLRRQWETFRSELEKAQGPLPELAADWEEVLDESLEGVDRAVTIVRDIREFSHAGAGDQELVQLDDLLDQVLRVARPQLTPGTRVEIRYDAPEPIPCASQRLKQLFLNLVVNAAQSIEDEGVVRISTGLADGFALVTVEDDGCGIAPELLERVFDPFFTTKPVGSGTGLGLSISYEIVRSHGGQIWCESEPGRGSAFHVRLPRSGLAEEPTADG
jgi:signal transduction histidine kinase